MPDLDTVGWVVLAVGALIIGVSKTAIPGSSAIAVALFASVLPAKQSTGTILLLLIAADAFAIIGYRRDVNGQALVRLIPAVAVGLLGGVVFLALSNDAVVKTVIGVILLGVIGVTLVRRWRKPRIDPARSHRVAAVVYGSLGGFTTMVANAAGPVMSMYFLAARFSVREFLGTAAWFFALVNLAKIPFLIPLGMITPDGLLIDLVLVPLVVAGAVFGLWWAKRIDKSAFEWIVIVLSILSAVNLLLF